MTFHSLLPASLSDALVVCHRFVILHKAVSVHILNPTSLALLELVQG